MTLEHRFQSIFDFSYRNETENDIECKFRFRRPDFFKENLNLKMARIQKFTVNNNAIPLFIPERAVDTTYFNVSLQTIGNTGTVYNNSDTLSINSLKYFVIIRNTANTQGEIAYIQHIPESTSLVAPFIVQTDDTQYYLNEYYYYHDFTHFLSILSQTINLMANSKFGVQSNCNITIDKQTNSFIFYFNKTFIGSYQVEFSQSLIELFPLKNVKSPYTTGQPSYFLPFSDFESSSGTVTYKTTSCPIYEIIFPFSELLISGKDLGINFTQFMANGDFEKNNQQSLYESTILAYNIRTNQFTQIYDYYTYTNNSDSLWNNFSENSNSNSHIEISVNLRLKNNIIIPLKLKPNNLFTMTINGIIFLP
jgi:hypothetical protein